VSFTAPRQQPVQFGIPVNYETGQPLTEHQQKHLGALWSAAEMLYTAMHAAEGSAHPGDNQPHEFMSSRMRRAADHIEIATLLARKAALE
jgi:hypothetical protein